MVLSYICELLFESSYDWLRLSTKFRFHESRSEPHNFSQTIKSIDVYMSKPPV